MLNYDPKKRFWLHTAVHSQTALQCVNDAITAKRETRQMPLCSLTGGLDSTRLRTASQLCY